MFKLSFLIVFVLAGLCFGASSEDSSPSGHGAVSGASGDGTVDQGSSEQGQEASADGSSGNGGASADTSQAGETSDNQGTNPKETKTPDATKKTPKHVGEELPEFLGNLTERKSYALKLLSACDKEHKLWKINERNITFQNCTYTCLSESGELPPKENRIPTGLVCNKQKDTCPETGGCPPLPLPSC
uniref:Putative ixodes 8-cys protein n=1 Tax=Ixodes ricinus TaxID=34613 RepID=A0A0K8R375_IXORI